MVTRTCQSIMYMSDNGERYVDPRHLGLTAQPRSLDYRQVLGDLLKGSACAICTACWHHINKGWRDPTKVGGQLGAYCKVKVGSAGGLALRMYRDGPSQESFSRQTHHETAFSTVENGHPYPLVTERYTYTCWHLKHNHIFPLGF